MSNERPDNEIAWGKKLEEPDGIPPEPWAGKDAAWEKLYGRLHEKPRRRIPFWYWMAAACLLGVLYLAIRPGGTRQGREMVSAEKGAAETVTRRGGSAVKGSQAVAGQDATAAEHGAKGRQGASGQDIVGAGSALNGRRGAREQAAPGTENRAMVIRNKMPFAATREKPLQPAIGQPVIVKPDEGQSVVDTTITIAKLVIPPAKKKLRVVSINELSDPTPEAGTLAANSANNEKNSKSSVGYTHRHAEFGGTPFFRLIPPRNPALSNTMAATESAHYQLIKIKLSPKN